MLLDFLIVSFFIFSKKKKVRIFAKTSTILYKCFLSQFYI